MITREQIDSMKLDALALHIQQNPQDAYKILSRVTVLAFRDGEKHGKAEQIRVLAKMADDAQQPMGPEFEYTMKDGMIHISDNRRITVDILTESQCRIGLTYADSLSDERMRRKYRGAIEFLESQNTVDPDDIDQSLKYAED